MADGKCTVCVAPFSSGPEGAVLTSLPPLSVEGGRPARQYTPLSGQVVMCSCSHPHPFAHAECFFALRRHTTGAVCPVTRRPLEHVFVGSYFALPKPVEYDSESDSEFSPSEEDDESSDEDFLDVP